ncbi:PAS domain-containing hybrid sensor histidine kinase/response regulator [Chitinimonas naiadis]
MHSIHPGSRIMQEQHQTGIAARRLALIYAAFASLWILFSDALVASVWRDPESIHWISTLKGWFFVLITSFMLFGLVRRSLTQTIALTQRELKAQTEKAQALQLLASIVDHSTDAIFAKDLAGRYIVFNRETARVFGKKAEDALGSDDNALFPPAQAQIVRDNDLRVVTEDRVHTYEERVSTVDGDRIYLATKGPLRNEFGQIIGLFGVSRDITEREQMSHALREREIFTRAVLDSVSAEIAVLDQSGIIIAVNEPWRRFTARSAPTNNHFGVDVGSSYLEAYLPKVDLGLELSLKVRHGINAVLSGAENSFNTEFTDDSTDRKRWLSMNVTPLGNDLRGAVVVHIDITSRKNAESELQKLSLALEQSPVSILITDVDAHVEYVNEAFIRNTGYDRGEVIGKTPGLLNYGGNPPERFAAIWDTLSKGEIWRGEIQNKRKDGSEYTDFAIITPLRQPDGQISHYVAVQEDITDRKRIREELDQHRHHLEELVVQRTSQLATARQQAEAANHAKSAFLANMSHEIRTPMNAILGLTHILRRNQPTLLQAEQLDKIDTAGRHLMTLINDILDLSKIEAGRLQLEYTNFELGGLLENVHSIIGDAAEAKGLRLSIDCAGIPIWLCGDPTRLKQALLNYAGNAVKYTETGAVTIRVSQFESSDDHVELRVEVEDTGVGIDNIDITRLFEAFEQADDSTTRKYGGTGLGLAITRRLVNMMGGATGAYSNKPKGSVFWFTVRMKRGEPIASTAIFTPSKAETVLREYHAGTRVLLVDDSPVNREVALHMLHAIDFSVDVAKDGLEAVVAAEQGHFELVLMDVQMPNMDGTNAARIIRQLPGWQTIPIIAMTALAFDQDKSACIAAGMNDFVTKPVDINELYRVLLVWLQNQAPSSSVYDLVNGAWGQNQKSLREGKEKYALLLDQLVSRGVEVDKSLKAMHGDVNQYLTMLKRFVKTHLGDTQLLTMHITQKNFESARHLAHQLRGSAAALGVVGLSVHAHNVENYLHQQILHPSLCGEMESDIESINSQLLSLSVLMDNLTVSLPEEQLATLTPSETNRQLAELERLLAKNDTACIALARQYDSGLRATLGAIWSTMASQIDQFEFEKAFLSLKNFQNKQ